MVDLIQVKTPHDWRPTQMAYDTGSYCSHCRISNYDTRTEFCEDVADEKRIKMEKAERRHAPTEAAWAKLRSVLSKDEWDLLELQSKHSREHRPRDVMDVR